MSKEPRFYAWCDLEATGSDTDSPIIEIAVVITEVRFPFTEVGRFQAVARPEVEDWRSLMGEFVLNMHTVNGLAAIVDVCPESLFEVETRLIAYLKSLGIKPHDLMLAGSGVGHYDRRLIREQMRRFEKWLMYPVMDVGVIRRFLHLNGRMDLVTAGATRGAAPGASREEREVVKAHRSLDDALDHLGEFASYVELLGRIQSAEFVEQLRLLFRSMQGVAMPKDISNLVAVIQASLPPE